MRPCGRPHGGLDKQLGGYNEEDKLDKTIPDCSARMELFGWSLDGEGERGKGVASNYKED